MGLFFILNLSLIRFDNELLRVALSFIGCILEHVPGGVKIVESHNGFEVRGPLYVNHVQSNETALNTFDTIVHM